jgi:hypothetical protein
MRMVFLVGLGFELSALSWQSRCLSRAFSPFCFGYFRVEGLAHYFSKLALYLHPPDLSLLSR